jgi:hypothetical protein
MYKIIGADHKEYGPITAEQLRQWIAQGRVNGATAVLPEGSTEWTTVAELPDFADVLATAPVIAPPTPPGVTPVIPPETVLGRDYDLDIGSCITRSWDLVKKHFWPLIGISFLVILIAGVINQVVGLLSGPAVKQMISEQRVSAGALSLVIGTSILSGPIYTILFAGLFKYYLGLIRGQNPGIGDAFSGFNSAGQLLVLGFLTGFLTLLGYVLCLLPGLYLAVAWAFSIPLVIDRGLNFWEAMELSRRVVSKHWFMVFGFVLVIGLLACCGLIACCIGIFVSAPVAWVALMYAYEDIFSRQAG